MRMNAPKRWIKKKLIPNNFFDVILNILHYNIKIIVVIIIIIYLKKLFNGFTFSAFRELKNTKKKKKSFYIPFLNTPTGNLVVI